MTQLRNYTLALAALAMLAFSGCQNQRELDPAGGYHGDRILYEADKAILEAAEVFGEIQQFAQRNAIYVQSKPELEAFIADLDTKSDQWLRDALQARDAYKLARDGARLETLQERIAFLNTLMEQARAYILAQATQPTD